MQQLFLCCFLFAQKKKKKKNVGAWCLFSLLLWTKIGRRQNDQFVEHKHAPDLFLSVTNVSLTKARAWCILFTIGCCPWLRNRTWKFLSVGFVCAALRLRCRWNWTPEHEIIENATWQAAWNLTLENNNTNGLSKTRNQLLPRDSSALTKSRNPKHSQQTCIDLAQITQNRTTGFESLMTRVLVYVHESVMRFHVHCWGCSLKGHAIVALLAAGKGEGWSDNCGIKLPGYCPQCSF